MKKIKSLLAILLIAGSGIFLTSFMDEDPYAYNDNVLHYYTLLDEQIADFEEALWNEDYSVKQLQKEYDRTLEIYNKNFKQLKKIKPLKKDPGFHKAVVEFYKGVKKGLDNEYKQIMKMYNADEWKDSYGEKIYELDEQIVDKLIELEGKVTDSQEEFAKVYDIELVD